jgi:restriction endonuclease Mrr
VELKDKQLYFKLVDILEVKPSTRRKLIDTYINSLPFTKAELMDKSTNSAVNIKRSIVGSAINEMLQRGIIVRTEDGIYSAVEQKPVIIRAERCEQLILNKLSDAPAGKNALKTYLSKELGTDKTLTVKDDHKLFAVISETLRKLTGLGIITYDGKTYSLPQKVEARLDDINGMLSLKEEFRSRLHKKGGEFFEYYFMTLLEKHLVKNSKKVTSNTTTGGAMDGGIDGIIETVDSLGFRETIMVQTKNRTDETNETDVRGFYGAVCARQGSRGIFATTSTFHIGASNFLEGIDNCVGVDGNKIFSMALENLYGIKKTEHGLSVDYDII